MSYKQLIHMIAALGLFGIVAGCAAEEEEVIYIEPLNNGGAADGSEGQYDINKKIVFNIPCRYEEGCNLELLFEYIPSETATDNPMLEDRGRFKVTNKQTDRYIHFRLNSIYKQDWVSFLNLQKGDNEFIASMWNGNFSKGSKIQINAHWESVDVMECPSDLDGECCVHECMPDETQCQNDQDMLICTENSIGCMTFEPTVCGMDMICYEGECIPE